MPAQPPKIEAWSASLVADSSFPDVFRPTVPLSWEYFCGAVGYWLPHYLNVSASVRKQQLGPR